MGKVSQACQLLGVEPKCNICSSTTERLVRDHNHRTGLIRGILCEHCNTKLGIYEANKRRTWQNGDKLYKEWVSKYHDQIEAHLAIRTKIFYRGMRIDRPKVGVRVAGTPKLKGVRFD